MISYTGAGGLASRPAETRLVLLPISILFLAAAILAGRRRMGSRPAYLVEVAATLAALAAALVISRLDVPASAEALPFAEISQFALRFALSPAVSVLEVTYLAWLAATALRTERLPHADPPGRSIWLIHAGLVGLALLAANLPTLAVVWVAMGLSERWVRRHGTASSSTTFIGIAPGDVVLTVLLLTGAILGSSGSETLAAMASLAIVLAAIGRIAAADRGASSSEAERGVVTSSELAIAGALPGFALLAHWWPESSAVAASPLLASAAAIVGLAAAVFHWGGTSPVPRRRSWIALWLALAVAAGALGDGTVPGVAGAVAMLGIGFWRGEEVLRLRRIHLGAGGLVASGIPYLAAGAVLAGLAAQGAGLLAAGILSMGIGVSRFWGEWTWRPRPAEGSAVHGQVQFLVAAAVLVGAAVWTYAAVLPPSPPWAEAGFVLVISAVASVARRWASPARLGRLERALRWPDGRGLVASLRPGLEAMLGAVRNVRDVLEGDASLLWAFVIVLIAFVLLRSPS